MRHLQLTLAGLSVVLVASVAVAKEKKGEKPMDPQAMMEVYAKLATPGEPHKQFARLAGSWTTKTKEWMEPNKPPIESTGSAEMKMWRIFMLVPSSVNRRPVRSASLRSQTKKHKTESGRWQKTAPVRPGEREPMTSRTGAINS